MLVKGWHCKSKLTVVLNIWRMVFWMVAPVLACLSVDDILRLVGVAKVSSVNVDEIKPYSGSCLSWILKLVFWNCNQHFIDTKCCFSLL